MTFARRFLRPRRLSPAILIGLSLLASGCATHREETCAQFEESRKDQDYSTQYRFSETDTESAARNFKPLPRGVKPVVRLYRMQLEPAGIRPCRHLVIRREIYLQQNVRQNRTLEEVREIYAANGMRVATKTESIGDQLRTSGYYTGETRLPIPETTPLGKYRVVSKLIMKTGKKSKTVVLAKTSANFQVLPRQ